MLLAQIAAAHQEMRKTAGRGDRLMMLDDKCMFSHSYTSLCMPFACHSRLTHSHSTPQVDTMSSARAFLIALVVCVGTVAYVHAAAAPKLGPLDLSVAAAAKDAHPFAFHPKLRSMELGVADAMSCSSCQKLVGTAINMTAVSGGCATPMRLAVTVWAVACARWFAGCICARCGWLTHGFLCGCHCRARLRLAAAL